MVVINKELLKMLVRRQKKLILKGDKDVSIFIWWQYNTKG